MQRGRILYFWQLVALALAAVMIATNLLTWLNVALTPVAISCSFLVFPLFGGGLISYLIKVPRVRATGTAWLTDSHAAGQQLWAHMLADLTPGQRMAAFLLVAYVFVNFFGTFVFMSARHERVMDPAMEVRMMTGHAALFLLVAAGLYRAVRRRANP
jgi:hypothetical protein